MGIPSCLGRIRPSWPPGVRAPWVLVAIAASAAFLGSQVIEDAPVGCPGQHLPYRLSPDSFSEVNGKAEEAMIQVLCGWVEELVQTAQAKTLCMFGRNSGFIGLALQHRFGQCLRPEASLSCRTCIHTNLRIRFEPLEASSASTRTRIAQSPSQTQKPAWP